MQVPPISLGNISVTVLFVNNRVELIDTLPRMVDAMPALDEQWGRVVLVVPDKLRELLGWPRDAAPMPAIFSDALVFRHPGLAGLPLKPTIS